MSKTCSFQSSNAFLFYRRLHSEDLYIDIVILKTKKTFWHHALLFLLWATILYFLCNKWASELHDVHNARPRDPANITTGQNFLFWSLHSWKSNWCQNKKYGDSNAGNLQRVPYSKRALLEEITMYIASVFKVLQSCNARWFARKFYVTDHSPSAMSSCHRAFAVVRTSS